MPNPKGVAPLFLGSLTVLVTLGAAACVMDLGHLAGRATDEWTHTYPLAAGGEVRIGTTSGGVVLTVPESAKADVTATCTNGGIQISGAKLEISEQSRRRLEGRLNGGGTPIELHTTNGGVRLRTHGAEGT